MRHGNLMQLLEYGQQGEFYLHTPTLHESYMQSCHYGNIEGILAGINKFSMLENDYSAFRYVCRNKNFDGIKVFIDNNKTDTYILKIGLVESCKFGVLENVKYILNVYQMKI